MKLNKILSSALVFVMLFTSLVSLIPVTAFAAEGSNGVTVSVATGDSVITDAETIKKICEEYLEYGSVDDDGNDYTFETAQEMLDYELGLGYLDSVESGNYILYVNRYTGFVYYKNKVTGQILTSNPIDPTSMSEGPRKEVMSQLVISHFQLSNPNVMTSDNSINWIIQGSTMNLSAIENGISAQYCIGEVASSAAFLVPGAILKEDFEEYLVGPAFETLAQMLEEECGPIKDGQSFTSYNVMENEIDPYFYESSVTSILNKLSTYASKNYSSYTGYREIFSFITNLQSLIGYYSLVDPTDPYLKQDTIDLYAKKAAALSNGDPVFFVEKESLIDYRIIGKYIAAITPEYTADLADEHENNAGYVAGELNIPSFTCSINYTLDENGVLSVEVPVNSQNLSYNSGLYAIDSIIALKYFGAGDMNYDGYIFYPDGSGTIVEFGDFYFGADSTATSINFKVESNFYGNDYCYSSITGSAHHEQVTMPIYGMVSEAATNEDTKSLVTSSTVTNGFFAIVEEGSALTNLIFESQSGSHKYGFTYSKFKPSFIDNYDLSQSLSVSGLGSYKMVAKSSYSGSFKTVYTMLDDTAVAETAQLLDSNSSYSYYSSDYIGMANCYRDYLSKKGVLEALEETSLDLPLYIEALGSMDITKKILTFPVTVATSLTTFEDIASMYADLSDLSGYIAELGERAEEYRDKAENIYSNPDSNSEDERRAAQYLSKAEHYEDLVTRIEDITNVNFKLTGFANGGMYFTYPAKVKWENSVGGKKGFNNLLQTAAEINESEDVNFGIYPDFDFVYINNTSTFDGINNRSQSRMIDNRYASKQMYDAVSQGYETIYALLVSSDRFDSLYSKFQNKYSKYEISNLSVSTLGSDLNSNLNAKGIVDRETALNNVKRLLDRMANTDGYSLMTDVGNVYALEYVDHVINVSTDSSHFMDSSYAIPFFGLVFHGSLNYAGAPLNYSGSPEYDMLRSIENGASLYYIICNENTGFLKEDPLLSDYYGIDYENWFDKIVEQYTVLNEAIGDLQYHNIVDHDIVYAERVIDDDEMLDNYNRLALEYISKVNDCLSEKIDDKQKELRENGSSVPGLEVIIDRDSLMYTLAEMLGVDFEDDALATESAAKLATLKSISAVYAELNTELDTLLMTYPSVEYAYEVEIDVNKLALTDITLGNACSKIVEAIEAVITSAKERHPDRDIAVELNKDEIIAFVYDAIGIEAIEANAAIELDALIDSYESIYTTSDNELNFSSADVIYDSLYSYTTDSISTDKENYKYTDFTCDNGSVVMVTYKKGNETVIFLLNYNFFTVEITIDNTVDKSLLDGETKTYTLGQCEYVRIDNK